MDIQRINNTIGKLGYYLSNFNTICVSVSGGSDSDIIVHLIITLYRQYLNKIHFIFADTGLEYYATKTHLNFLEERYHIKIERLRGDPIPLVVKNKGIPIVSKLHSEAIEAYCRDVPWACKLIDHQDRAVSKGFVFTPKLQRLAVEIKSRGIKISDACCDFSKKKPLHQYQKEIGCDLLITGERKCEGGRRSIAYTSCFVDATKSHEAKYMPLYYWDNETKAYYKEHERIAYSDCYEVYGMTRTGCVGCPFNSKVHEELIKIKKYEPNLFKAVISVFGTSYKLMDEFDIRKVSILKGLSDV